MVLFTVALADGVLILTVGGVMSFCSVKSAKSALFPALSVSRTVTAPSERFACGMVASYVPDAGGVAVAAIAEVSSVFPILTTSADFKPLPFEASASLAVNVNST